MRVIQITVRGSMRLGKALNRKEQSRHQDHEGLYERMTRHSLSLFYHIKLRNRLNTADRDMFRKCIVFATGVSKWHFEEILGAQLREKRFAVKAVATVLA